MRKLSKNILFVLPILVASSVANASQQYKVNTTEGQEINVYSAYDTQLVIKELTYTKTQVDNKLNGYATTSELDAKANVADVYTKTETETTINEALADYATTNEVNAALADKANADAVYTKTETETAITNALTGYATTSELDAKVDIDDAENMINTAVNTAVTGAVATKQDALSEVQLEAVNSGVTAENVAQITTNTDDIADLDDRVDTNEADIAANKDAIAINAAAIQSVSENIGNTTADIERIDNKVYKLSEDVKELRRSFNTGMASMAAMTALVPNARATGNTQLSIGTGAYNGHTAVAIGGFHYVNDDVLLNAGVAWGNSSQAVYKAGVTWSW